MTVPSSPELLSAHSLESLAHLALHDRIAGVLFGAALGDAIGLYTESLSSDEAVASYPSRKFVLCPPASGTPFRRDPHRGPHVLGDWTDDTDHAMLVLLSYLHGSGRGEPSPLDFAARLRTWVNMGLRALDTLPLGLGQTVGAVVQHESFLENPAGAAYAVWVERGRDVAPNGSLMRTHPLGPMCLWMTLERTFEVAASFSIVTHVDPRCVVACVAGTALVRGLLRGEVSEERHIDEVVDAAVEWYLRWRAEAEKADESRKGDPTLDIGELYRHSRAGTLDDLQLDDEPRIGYVYKTFGSGVLLLRQAMRQMASATGTIKTEVNMFEPLVTNLIMHGGDADTNACFAGALLGAYLGFKALPPNWRDGLRHGQWLLDKSEALRIVLRIGSGSYSGAMDKDTHPDGGRGMLTKEQMEERWAALQAKLDPDLRESRNA